MPSTNRVRVGILGATGYSGIEAVRLLAGHPFVELSVLTSEHYAGREVADVYRHLAGVDLPPFEELRTDLVKGRAEVVFSCLPEKVGTTMVADLVQSGVKVVDFSADFRLKDRGDVSRDVRRRSSGARAAQAGRVWAQRVQSSCAARGEPGRESRMLPDRRAARAAAAHQARSDRAVVDHHRCEVGHDRRASRPATATSYSPR